MFDLKHFQENDCASALTGPGSAPEIFADLEGRLYRKIKAMGARQCGQSKSAQLLQ